MIVVVAECRILQEHWQDFEEQMDRISPIVREEPGCLRYDIFTSVGEPGLFVIFEEWENRTYLDDHLATPHMKEHGTVSIPWSTDPVTLSLYEVSAVERRNL